MRKIWKKVYFGFEHFADYFRDVHEAVDQNFNENMRDIPPEFQGTITVTIDYEHEPDKQRNDLAEKLAHAIINGHLSAEVLDTGEVYIKTGETQGITVKPIRRGR